MNNMTDVERVVDELTELIYYHTQAKATMKPFEWRKTAKEAVTHVNSLEQELSTLKLSADDRLHFNLLREAFKSASKAFVWESRGKSAVALVYSLKGLKAIGDYKLRKNIGG